MPSKFESKLFPSIARITAAVAVVFVGTVYFVATKGSSTQEKPFKDYYSPDNRYVAAIENNSSLNLTAEPIHSHWYNLAEGEGRIVDAKWLNPRLLQVDILPGDPKEPGDPSELPRERSSFGTVRIQYRLVQEKVASR